MFSESKSNNINNKITNRHNLDENINLDVFTDDSFELTEEIFSEPDTQADSIVNKYESKWNDNNHNVNRTSNLEMAISDENLLEWEINKEELPSFNFPKRISRKSNFHDYRAKKVEATPVFDLFSMLNMKNDPETRANWITKIIKQIKSGINLTDRK